MSETLRAIPLYQLADMRDRLESELFLSDGVLSPEQETEFDAITGTSDKKLARCGLMILELEATARVIELEENRLAERRRAILKDIERRKEFIRLMMIRFGKRQVAAALVTITLMNNSALTVTTVAPSTAGPQRDLFARARGSHRRTERGNHIRVR